MASPLLFPVSPGRYISMDGPFPLTPVEWQRMMTVLELFRPGLVTSGLKEESDDDGESVPRVHPGEMPQLPG